MNQLYIAHHTLRVSEPQSSLSFYQKNLGMRLVAYYTQEHTQGVEQHYFLGFLNSEVEKREDGSLLGQSCTLLELVHQPSQISRESNSLAKNQAGYWKIGITLKDVDLARQSLMDLGIEVSPAQQFLNIGYLCHLSDPEGYSIELLQHQFAQNHCPQLPQMEYPLRSLPRLGQITLRVKNPKDSLKFYVEGLGMRLLSRQVVEPYQFTLYFLACTSEEPPYNDIDSVNNREWLWQRPYTLLELQHIWGTEQGEFAYRVDSNTGFERISFALRGIDEVMKELVDGGTKIKTSKHFDTMLQCETVTVFDPDGYAIRFIET